MSRKGGGRATRSAPRREPRVTSAVDASPVDLVATPADGAVPRPSGRPRPPGQRLYDMPYSAVAPRMVNPALGLHTLVARAGHNAAYEIDVTLLDAPDHRLIRSGVLLAHRVLDGRGEWYLTAPDWQPLLPKDRIELMGHADLPEELADLIRPLRRRAPLGPVAALRCDRREFALRGEAGTTLALLRDDRVTVRRGGLTTARYREVTITPVGPGLTEDQQAWVERAVLGAGATRVPRFPRLVHRLGAPANGPTDLGRPTPFRPDATLEQFLGQLLVLRLRRLVEADLAVRGGDTRAGEGLAEQARSLRAELTAVAVLAQEEWLGDLRDELDWLLGEGDEPAVLARRIRSERYVALLDRLVAAARAPRLGDAGEQPAETALRGLLGTVLAEVTTAATAGPDDAGPKDDDVAAAALPTALARVAAAVALTRLLLPDDAAAVEQRLAGPRRLLADLGARPASEAAALAATEGLSAAEVFAAGRAYERQADADRRTRAAFVKAWTRAQKKLTRHGVVA